MPSSRSDDRSDADEPRSGASSADTFRSLADSDEAYARTLQNAVDNDEDPDDGDEGFQSVRTRPRRTNNTSNTGGLQTGSASASSRSGYEHGAPGSIGDRLVATGERITGKIGRLVKDSDFSFLIQLDKEKEFGFTHWFLGQKKNFCYKSQEALALRDGTGANADRVSLRLKYNPQKKSDPTQKFVADAIIVKHKDIPTDVFFNGPPQGVYDPNLNACGLTKTSSSSAADPTYGTTSSSHGQLAPTTTASSSGTSRAVRRTRQDLYETGDRIEGTCCKIHLGQKGYALLMSPEMEGKVLLGAKFFPVEKSLDEGDRVSFKVTPNTFKEGEYMALDVMHVEGGGGSRYSNSASGAFGAGAGSSSGDREQGAQGAGAGQGSAAGGQVSLTSFPGPAVPSGPSAITTPKSSGASAGSGAAASGGAGISSAASRVPAASKPPLVGHAVPPAATRQAGTLSKSSSESGSKLTTQQLACFSRLELAFTKQRIRARVIKSLPGTKGYSNALVTSSQIQDDDLNEPQGGTVLALQKRVVRDNWVFMPFCEGQVVEFSLCENPAPPDGGEDVSRKFLADEIEFPELMQSTELRNSIGLTQKLHFPARMEWEIALSSGKLFTGEIVSTHQSPGDHSSTSTYSDYCFVQAPELRQSMLAHRNRFADNYKDVVELKKGMQLQFRVIRNPHEWVHDRKFPYVADQIKPIFSFKAGAGTGPVAAGEVVTNLASATTSGSGAVLGAGGVSMSSWSTMLKTKSVTKSTSATADEPAEATQFALVASIQTETIVGATGQHVARKRMEIPENFFTGGGADGGGGGSSSQRRQLRAVVAKITPNGATLRLLPPFVLPEGKQAHIPLKSLQELEEEYVFLDCFGRKKLKEGDHLKLKAVDVIQETTAKGAKKYVVESCKPMLGEDLEEGDESEEDAAGEVEDGNIGLSAAREFDSSARSSGSRLDSIEDNEEEVEAEAQEGGYEQLQEESQRGRAGPLVGQLPRASSRPPPGLGDDESEYIELDPARKDSHSLSCSDESDYVTSDSDDDLQAGRGGSAARLHGHGGNKGNKKPHGQMRDAETTATTSATTQGQQLPPDYFDGNGKGKKNTHGIKNGYGVGVNGGMKHNIPNSHTSRSPSPSARSPPPKSAPPAPPRHGANVNYDPPPAPAPAGNTEPVAEHWDDDVNAVWPHTPPQGEDQESPRGGGLATSTTAAAAEDILPPPVALSAAPPPDLSAHQYIIENISYSGLAAGASTDEEDGSYGLAIASAPPAAQAALAVFLDGLVARLRSLPLPERGEQVSRIGESPEYKRFKQRVAHCSLAQTKGELLKLLKHDHRFEIRNEAPASQPAKNYWAYLKNDSNYATSANGSFDVLEQYYQLVEEILLENGGAAARVDTGQLEADPRIGELMRSHPVPWADAKGPLMHILYACPDTNRFTLEVDRSRSYTVKLGRENKHAVSAALSSAASALGAAPQQQCLVQPSGSGAEQELVGENSSSSSSSAVRAGDGSTTGQYDQQQQFYNTTRKLIQEATAPLLQALEEQKAQNEKLQSDMAKLQGMVATLMQRLPGTLLKR
eukprot:CAMPEP_0178988122 /NCGR_PEP_ID=MMETSP0795-20121207/3640_1 /TAXON_ID=88552 /ORGANISM="Amoebophrya sp., Strain Ameob2" /LENGTH=1555 /DNA_ID=CAMNT_0020679371 /DNA_START=352 /DNA_END=5019 /DNA_ORIENTATION=+